MNRLMAWALTATILGLGLAGSAPADDILADVLKKAQIEAQVAQQALKAKTADVERLQKEVAELREEIRQAQKEREELFKKPVPLGAGNPDVQVEVARLREQNAALGKQVAELRGLLNPGRPLAKEPAAVPAADGLVLAVSPQGLVEISLGSDDGIQVGHELEVFRMNQGQATYLGRIVIRRTRPERAVGEKLRNFPAQVNDRVMTKTEK